MSANLKSVRGKSVRERVTTEEWQMRVDLAAAYQLAHLYKWTDLIYTHFSARVWVWMTQLISGLASCMQPWITKPA